MPAQRTQRRHPALRELERQREKEQRPTWLAYEEGRHRDYPEDDAHDSDARRPPARPVAWAQPRAQRHAGAWSRSCSLIELGAVYEPVKGRSVHGPHEVHNDVLKVPYAGASQVRHMAGTCGTHTCAPGRGDDVARLKIHSIKHLRNCKTLKSVNKLENLQK
jgi:hypothetical protein